MKKLLMGLAGVIAFAMPAPAYASHWYWSQGKAEAAIYDEPNVANVTCSGVGGHTQTEEDGGWLFQRFDCNVGYEDYERDARLTVLSRNGYSLTWVKPRPSKVAKPSFSTHVPGAHECAANNNEMYVRPKGETAPTISNMVAVHMSCAAASAVASKVRWYYATKERGLPHSPTVSNSAGPLYYNCTYRKLDTTHTQARCGLRSTSENRVLFTLAFHKDYSTTQTTDCPDGEVVIAPDVCSVGA